MSIMPAQNTANITDLQLRRFLNSPDDFFQRFGVLTSDVLEDYPTNDLGIREALVYWQYPNLDENQKKRIMNECAQEVEVIRRHLWNEGIKILWKRKQEMYESSPWLFRKFTDFQTYLDKDPVANSCKVYGIAMMIMGFLGLLTGTLPIYPSMSLVAGGALLQFYRVVILKRSFL